MLAGVSRETRERLNTYADLLRKWQRSINLVGPRTIDDLWNRHFTDSAQLLPLIPADTPASWWTSAAAPVSPVSSSPSSGVAQVHLIESDQRKATFLREVARATGTPVTVHAKRIEQVAPFPADVVSARALAPLGDLLGFAAPFLRPDSLCLFPKGQMAEDELTAASKTWNMNVDRIQSVTDPSATILRISQVSRA